jgi:hypothetical protein
LFAGCTLLTNSACCWDYRLISAVPPSAAALAAAQSQDRAPIKQAGPEGALIESLPANTGDLAVIEDDVPPVAHAVPIANPVSTHVAEEDRAALVPAEAQVYQPHVLSFDPPTAAALHAASDGGALKPTAPPAAPTEELVAALQGSVGGDARSTVLDWARQHPGGGASVTPQDVGRVIQSVPMSLDQAVVALELARYLGRPHLTCAHIAAACAASAFFRAEVAGAMGPYAGDPGNREIVLAQLPSYDRENLSRAFA